MENNDVMAQSLIEPNLTSYVGFFDHDWCKHIFDRVETTPLKGPIDTLMLAWRSTNGVHLLPWLLVQSLRGFADGDFKGSLRFRARLLGRIIRGICDSLEDRMPPLNFDQRTELRCGCYQVGKRGVAGLQGRSIQS